MPSYKRTVYLLPAGIVVLGATIAIVVALVGTAAAAASSSVDTGSQNFRGARDLTGAAARLATVSSVDTGSQNFRGARDLGLAPRPATVSSVDTGSQNFRGARDLGLAPRPATVSSVDTGSQNFRGARDLGLAPRVGVTPTIPAAMSAPKITEALQPGQTVSSVTPDNGSGSLVRPTSWAPAYGPTEAPQPGQTGW